MLQKNSFCRSEDKPGPVRGVAESSPNLSLKFESKTTCHSCTLERGEDKVGVGGLNPELVRISALGVSAHLRFAYEIAWNFSNDNSTKNGAVIVDEYGDAVASGYNHYPRGVEITPVRAERPEKYSWVIHAEQHAIAHAAKLGKSTLGTTMICPWAPCTKCAQSIYGAGIKTLVVHKNMMDRTPSATWPEDLLKANQLLREVGVTIIEVEGHLGGVPGLMNGVEWSP